VCAKKKKKNPVGPHRRHESKLVFKHTTVRSYNATRLNLFVASASQAGKKQRSKNTFICINVYLEMQLEFKSQVGIMQPVFFTE
jgi:hypothetical protein